MLTLIGTELYKLRTIRTPWILLLIQLGLVVLGVVVSRSMASLRTTHKRPARCSPMPAVCRSWP